MSRPTRLVPAALTVGALLAVGATVVRVCSALPATYPQLPTGRLLSPLGEHTGVGSFPANMIGTPDGRFVIATDCGPRQALTVVRTSDGKIVSQLSFNNARKDDPKLKQGLYYGLALQPAAGGGGTLYVSRGQEDRVTIYQLSADGTLTDTGREILNRPDNPREKPLFTAGLALSSDGRRLYAVNNETYINQDNIGSVSILETETGKRAARVAIPGFPLAVAALTKGPDADRKIYVTSERDRAVAVVDAKKGILLANIDTGDQPMALVLDKSQKRLYVTNAGSDTITVIDTKTDEIAETLLLRPDDVRGLPGATPTGLALSPDGKRLYVTLGDMNAVAVVRTAGLKLEGYLPTGWYPTAVVPSNDGRQLYVSSAKGVEARVPNGTKQGPSGSWGQHIHSILEGTVSRIDLPTGDDLRRETERVMANNFIGTGRRKADEVHLDNPGIQHVIYIIKENRTYDQVYGDLPQGNGDPKLCLFPREITPNMHALAERFVLLDNFYCAADVSADGWNYSTAGISNEYVTRNAPYSYSGRGRVYDYEGENNAVSAEIAGSRDVATPSGGYLWDNAVKHGVTLRNYGFFSHLANPNPNGATAPPQGGQSKSAKITLASRTDESFLQFNLSYADSEAWVKHGGQAAPLQLKEAGSHHTPSRFTEWKLEWDQYVRNGNLPGLMTLRLGRDHTAGTVPGTHSPRAMVADNDYAVGQVVEAVSKSPYWRSTVICILQDDAQAGQDHVDAHRSPALVISPFIRRGTVDHHFYNTDSMLHTMEQLLGLPPMCQLDAIASPIRVFGAQPTNLEPYEPILPDKKIITEVNGVRAYGAARSAKLDFSAADRVPDDVLSEIVWHSVKGANTPVPPKRAGLRLLPASARKDADD